MEYGVGPNSVRPKGERCSPLQKGGALPVAEVAEVLRHAASGLNAAHKLGIIHRDLKPDNIFLTYPEDESVPPASPAAQADIGAPLISAKIMLDRGRFFPYPAEHERTG
jgi:serine/threonine protein kinase